MSHIFLVMKPCCKNIIFLVFPQKKKGLTPLLHNISYKIKVISNPLISALILYIISDKLLFILQLVKVKVCWYYNKKVDFVVK